MFHINYSCGMIIGGNINDRYRKNKRQVYLFLGQKYGI
jgi:hypothetical protein